MKLGINFDGVEETKTEFELLPEGQYVTTVTNTELKANKSGTGKYLKVTLKIVGQKYKNRVLFQNFTTEHDNTVAESIGRGQLKNLIQSAGLDPTKFTETEDLHGCSVIANVSTKHDPNYGEQNVIKSFKKIDLGTDVKKTVQTIKKTFGKDTKVTVTAKDEFGDSFEAASQSIPDPF